MMLTFLLIITISIISLLSGYFIVRRYSWLTLPGITLGFVLLAFSILPRVFPAYFYYLYPSNYLLEVLLACAFVLVGVLIARYSDSLFRVILQGILTLLMGYFILFPYMYLSLYADEIRSLHYRVVDGVTIQSSYYGCVPSSLATILRIYGLEYTEGDLAYALHTTTMGTDYSRIPLVVHELGQSQGLVARFVHTDLNGLKEYQQPAILIVYAGHIRHAVALLGFEGGQVILGDPLSGIRKIPEKSFQALTRWTGLAAVVSAKIVQ